MQLPAAIIFALVFFSLAGCDSLKTTPRSSKITTPETKTSNQVVIEKPGSSQSGDPTKSIGSQIVVPQITMVALGSQHTCAGDQNGRVQCWGKDERKDAENKSVDLLAPDGQFIDFGAGRTAKYLAAYSTQTCAILDNGKPYCWTVDSSQPLYSDFAFDENQQFIKIAAGRSHACAIDTLGAVWCFGGSDFIGSKITVGKNTFNTAVKINFTTNLKATNIDVAENYQNAPCL